MDPQFFENHLIVPVPMPESRIVNSNSVEFLQHWSYVLFCAFNNLDIHLVDIEHTKCNTPINNAIFSNRDHSIKVIFSGPAYLDWYEEWESNIIVQEIFGHKIIKFHCPVYGHEN